MPPKKKAKTMSVVAQESVAILDCGAQYGKVIDRRVRELNVVSELLPLDTPTEELKKYSAIIISGGPQSVYGPNAPKYNDDLFTVGIPILGICYGMQLMNAVNGGKIEKKETREDGQFEIKVDETCELFKGLGGTTEVLLTHGDSVGDVAPGFKTVASAKDSGICAAIAHAERQLYGVQFHPEVDLTVEGQAMFKNFLFGVCKLKGTFTMQSRQQVAIDEIQAQVGDKKVLVLVSGGVDSSVCAVLLKAALPKEKIYALHVDLGFMRKDESVKVEKALSAAGIPLKVVDASQTFFNATTTIDGKETEPLCKTVNPEVKRKIIGDTYMKVSEAAVKDFGLVFEEVFLAQGTLRPDLIESASKIASANANVIKTHHNDTQLVRALRDAGRIIEPLRDYHKDEVRAVGQELGLPHALVWRQPFPGPGLAIRILCTDQPYLTKDDPEIVEKLGSSFQSDTIKSTLLPCRTVGVQGDARTYSNLVSLSSSGAPDWAELLRMAKEIPKKIHQVNRIVYAFGEPLPQGQIKTVTNTCLSPDVIATLQQADEIVNQILMEYDLIKKLSQVPVILFPVDFGETGKRSIAIRTFITSDFMTGVPACPGKTIPEEAVNKMVSKIMAEVPGIARVCFDLTSKPPATTEWE